MEHWSDLVNISWMAVWLKHCKSFYGRNLQMFAINNSVGSSNAFPAWGQSHKTVLV